jgi:hypothetical protein
MTAGAAAMGRMHEVDIDILLQLLHAAQRCGSSHGCVPIDGGASLPGGCGVPSLNQEVALDIVEDAVVVILCPAKAEKYFMHVYLQPNNRHLRTSSMRWQASSYLHSFKKFLQVTGQSSTNRSITMSPRLVSSNTAILMELMRCYSLDCI